MTRSNAACSLCLLLGILSLEDTLAWIPSSRNVLPSTFHHTTNTRRSSSTTTTRWWASSSSQEDDEDSTIMLTPGTSRRQWFSNAMATTVASASALTLWDEPALAATTKVTPTASICDPTVSVWERNGRLIYLLGTAHISSQSAQLAGDLVRDTHPDAVFVELDLKRVGGTSEMARKMRETNQFAVAVSAPGSTPEGSDEAPKPTKIMVSPVGRPDVPIATTTTTSATATAATEASSTAVATATNTAEPLVPPSPAPSSSRGGFLQNLGAAAVGKGIRGLYSKLGSEGFNPGEEFVTAIQVGREQGAAIVLGDQDVDITLRRMAQAFQQTDLNRLLNPDSELEQSMREMLPASATPTSGMSESEAFRTELSNYVETIKTKDNVKRIMALMKQEAPAIYQVMVTERDAYMAAGLNTLNEFTIITAVMGLAHVDGVETNLRQNGWRVVPLNCPKRG